MKNLLAVALLSALATLGAILYALSSASPAEARQVGSAATYMMANSEYLYVSCSNGEIVRVQHNAFYERAGARTARLSVC